MHATPRPLIVPLFSSLPSPFFFFFIRLILARSCNRLVCYSREPINISFKYLFKSKIVENRWKIRIDTCLVYNTKWYTHVTEFKNYSPLKKRKNNNNPSIFVFYSRHLVSSLGLFSNPREIFSSPLLCRDDDFEKRISRASKKKKNWCVGGTRSPLSKLLGYIRNKGERKRGESSFSRSNWHGETRE